MLDNFALMPFPLILPAFLTRSKSSEWEETSTEENPNREEGRRFFSESLEENAPKKIQFLAGSFDPFPVHRWHTKLFFTPFSRF